MPPIIAYMYAGAYHCPHCTQLATARRSLTLTEPARLSDLDEHGLCHRLQTAQGEQIAPVHVNTPRPSDDGGPPLACADCGADLEPCVLDFLLRQYAAG